MKTDLLGCLQEKIMDIVWAAQEPLKPSEVKVRLKGDYAYTTVMTVLKRMVDKKILSRTKVGKAYVYSPLQNRENFVKSNLTNIYGDLVGSYGKLAISQFVDALKTNKEDLKLLEDYLKKNG